MFRLLIFGGTTEGRRLAEFCAECGIAADVSVTTDYGASLLPEGPAVLSGKMDAAAMTALLYRNRYAAVIDATHPYAEEATGNILSACKNTGTAYYRLLRDSAGLYGETVESIPQMIERLNQCDAPILSTLGSKCAEQLTGIGHFLERVWLRILPVSGMKAHCIRLGFDAHRILCEKGPFTVAQNLEHIRISGAGILLTKESGAAGGYAEKAEAVRKAGIRMITVTRPAEKGFRFEEITARIRKMQKEYEQR